MNSSFDSHPCSSLFRSIKALAGPSCRPYAVFTSTAKTAAKNASVATDTQAVVQSRAVSRCQSRVHLWFVCDSRAAITVLAPSLDRPRGRRVLLRSLLLAPVCGNQLKTSLALLWRDEGQFGFRD